jgi:hypothetical protein
MSLIKTVSCKGSSQPVFLKEAAISSLILLKCLYSDGDGFTMLYKRLDNGKLQWPRKEKEVRFSINMVTGTSALIRKC